MIALLAGAVLGAPLIIVTVSVITGDFDYTGRHPNRRDVYARWRR